jgi:hypothetical protein
MTDLQRNEGERLAKPRHAEPKANARLSKKGNGRRDFLFANLCSNLCRSRCLPLSAPAERTMPGMSGLELLPKAKALRPDVPIIMITAYGDAETKRKALENGAEALLTKPIDFVMLRNEIDMRVERTV